MPAQDITMQTPTPACLSADSNVEATGLTFRLCRHAIAQFDLPLEWLQDLVDTVERVTNSDLWQRATAGSLMSEVPIVVYDQTSSPPALLRGVIDLIVRTDAGTIIVDFKSERVTDADDLAQLATYYTPQLQAYAHWWQKTTEDPVVEIGVFFTHAGEYQPVPLPGQEAEASALN